MQETLMQPQMLPFIKLVQSNMSLLMQFSMSPEVMSQMMSSAQGFMQRGPSAAASPLAQSPAFNDLMQGMIKNYTEFMTELGQSGMAMLAQGPAAMMQQMQDATEQATKGSTSRGKRGRQSEA